MKLLYDICSNGLKDAKRPLKNAYFIQILQIPDLQKIKAPFFASGNKA